MGKDLAFVLNCNLSSPFILTDGGRVGLVLGHAIPIDGASVYVDVVQVIRLSIPVRSFSQDAQRRVQLFYLVGHLEGRWLIVIRCFWDWVQCGTGS